MNIVYLIYKYSWYAMVYFFVCIVDQLNATMHVITTYESYKSFVSLVYDENNKESFFIKQTKDQSFKKQFTRIREVLASSIAQSTNLHINKVSLIPSQYEMLGKIYKDRIATKHNLVPGRSIERSLRYRTLMINQQWKSTVPLCQRGLTKAIIKTMAVHPDLPQIIAFDTFIANTDRLAPNLLYSLCSDSFYGIDLEISFNKNLAQLACMHIETLLNEPVPSLDHNDIVGLVIYRDTLQVLCEKNNPEVLCKRLDDILVQTQMTLSTLPADERDYVQLHKRRIHENYRSSITLLALLNQLITKYTKCWFEEE